MKPSPLPPGPGEPADRPADGGEYEEDFADVRGQEQAKRAIEAVQAACSARGHDVAIGGELFSDAMGDAGTAEGTYIGMVRHNIDTIVQALNPPSTSRP